MQRLITTHNSTEEKKGSPPPNPKRSYSGGISTMSQGESLRTSGIVGGGSKRNLQKFSVGDTTIIHQFNPGMEPISGQHWNQSIDFIGSSKVSTTPWQLLRNLEFLVGHQIGQRCSTLGPFHTGKPPWNIYSGGRKNSESNVPHWSAGPEESSWISPDPRRL